MSAYNAYCAAKNRCDVIALIKMASAISFALFQSCLFTKFLLASMYIVQVHDMRMN